MRDQYLLQSDLIQRGWTKTAIEKHLGEPDEIGGSYYSSKQVSYLYDAARVERAEQNHEWRAWREKIDARRDKIEANRKIRLEAERAAAAARKVVEDRERDERLVSVSLLDAIRTVSRAAHYHRDQAESAYRCCVYSAASQHRRKKEKCYAAKERGIVRGHKIGLLRYAGQSPQGMAVYEYGDGGMSCFHSCLHPAGVDRPPVPDHPEVLTVPTKTLEYREDDCLYMLSHFPDSTDGYERSAPPRKPREERTIYCHRCGEPGHIARDCDDYTEEYMYA